ncbi:MAG: hypothetical protein IJE05_02930 [Clostridia bacterium]|nr:hypothetical protein [Clostridia bacterium]
MNEEEWEEETKKAKIKNKKISYVTIFFVAILLLGIYYVVTSPFWKGYYIADFEGNTKLNQQDYDKIIEIMNKENNIEITKIACAIVLIISFIKQMIAVKSISFKM